MRLMKWEKRWITAIYGNSRDGKLRRRRGLLSIAKKNGKTELMAGIFLAHLCGPEAVAGSTLLSVAGGSKDQATILFNRMASMIRLNPELDAILEVSAESRARITHKTLYITYEAIGTSARSSHGSLPHVFCFDEMAQARDFDLYDSLDLGQTSLPGEGLGFVISTNSTLPGNPFADLVDGIRRDQKEGRGQEWHIKVFQADPKKDLYDIKNAEKANPSLVEGLLDRESIKREISEALSIPSRRAAFKAYRLNLGIESLDALLDVALWQSLKEPRPLEEMEGKLCYAGIDLSNTRDLTSLALWFPEEGWLWSTSWLPARSVAEREATDKVPYAEWEKGGWLTISDKAIDYTDIVATVMDLTARFNVAELRYDRWGMDYIIAARAAMGIEEDEFPPMTSFGQGYSSMGPAVDEIERLMQNDRLRHCDSPVLNMCIANCGTAIDRSATSPMRKPVKIHENGRIDAAVAAIMACAPSKEEPPEEMLTAEQFMPEVRLG